MRLTIQSLIISYLKVYSPRQGVFMLKKYYSTVLVTALFLTSNTLWAAASGQSHEENDSIDKIISSVLADKVFDASEEHIPPYLFSILKEQLLKSETTLDKEFFNADGFVRLELLFEQYTSSERLPEIICSKKQCRSGLILLNKISVAISSTEDTSSSAEKKARALVFIHQLRNAYFVATQTKEGSYALSVKDRMKTISLTYSGPIERHGWHATISDDGRRCPTPCTSPCASPTGGRRSPWH